MATVKLILWKHDQKKDGRFPIAIRITKDRKTRYIFTGKYVHEKDWDAKECEVKKSHNQSGGEESAGRLNAYLRTKRNEVEGIADKAEISQEDLSSKQIKRKVKRQSGNISFFQLACERIKNKHLEGVFSVAKSEMSILYNIHEFLTFNTSLPKQKAIDGIKERRKQRISLARKRERTLEDDLKFFVSNKSLSFDEIDLAFIGRFKSFCTAYLGQETRTVTNQIIFLRTMYNQAIKENITDTKNYPFGGDNEKIKIGSSNKIGLTRQEVGRIEALELEEGSAIWHTKNVWLFAFYFAGVRISDVLEIKWSDFMDGRLYYQMNKNEKPVSLAIPEQAQAILEAYSSDKKSNLDYVFPFLKKANQDDPQDLFTKSRNASKQFNKYLKRIADLCGIEKALSNHIARHTFGNIAKDKIHPHILQKLYRHTDLKTTIIYQSNFIHDETDEALISVLD